MKKIIPLVLLVVFVLSVYLFANTRINTEVKIREPSQFEDLSQTVVRVVDGDTFVLLNGRVVRLIGIDTPEYGQPYYEQATERLVELLEGKNVTLESDVSNVDNYSRLLRYAYVNDTFVNLVMVEEGYAKVLIIKPNIKYVNLLKKAESESRNSRLGIWNK